MRIIAGQWRSRSLVAPAGMQTRPTTGRLRESLFAHLEASRLTQPWSELRVLDLFAGSGALALEALSRGAAHAVLVETARPALQAIDTNVAALGCAARVQVVRSALPAALDRLRAPVPFGVVFVDPPYAAAEGPLTLGALARFSGLATDGLIVYERDRRLPVTAPDGLVFDGEREWGDTCISFFRPR